MKARMGMTDRMVRSGIVERVPKATFSIVGRVRAVVKDLETDRIVQRVHSRNTIVTTGISAALMSLMPVGLSSNPYRTRPINHWRMGTGPASGTLTTPALGDVDLDHTTGTPIAGNGSAPWYKELAASNFTLKKVQSDDTLDDESDLDVVDAVTIAISMGTGEANGADSGGVFGNKTYVECGLFYYYPTDDPFPSGTYSTGQGGGTKDVDERLFARSTLAALTKTPTRQIDLEWDLSLVAVT